MDTSISLSDVGNLETEAFEAFYANHVIQSPEPEEPSSRVIAHLGWEFYATLLATVGAVILAATRTVSQFYAVATAALAGNFAYLEAGAALIGVEGLLVVTAAIRAKHQQENPRLLRQAEYIALGISVMAGLGQALHGVPGIDQRLVGGSNYALAVVMGLGVSWLAWAAGEILGQLIKRAENMAKGAQADYATERATWRSEMLAAWAKSPYNKFAMKDIRASVRTPRQNNRTNERTPNAPNERTGERRDIIEGYLRSMSTPTFVPGPAAIVDFFASQDPPISIAKSYAHDVRKRFIANRDVFANGD